MTSIKIEPFRISTITAVAYVSTTATLDLQQLYDSVDIIKSPNTDSSSGFTFVEFGPDQFKGYHKKKSIIRRKIVEKKRFDGFVSVLFLHYYQGAQLTVNVKVFKNAKLQVTGLKTVDQGHHVVESIVQYIKRINPEFPVISDIQHLTPGGFRVCLINSDFWVTVDGKRATILREKLYSLLSKNYSTFCVFDSVVHPSVRANYCYNSSYMNDHGLCECVGTCYGKGSGSGEGQCKKITIAVFGSGCIIITGSQSVAQLQKAYEFICNVIKKHASIFIKELAPSSSSCFNNTMSRAALSSIMLNHKVNVP